MFDIYTTFDLSYLGDSWKDCYLKFSTISVKDVQLFTGLEKTETKEGINKTLDVLSKKFIEGFAISEGVRVTVKKEDLGEFPVDILLAVIQKFTAGLDKKKEITSLTPSEDSETTPPVS